MEATKIDNSLDWLTETAATAEREGDLLTLELAMAEINRLLVARAACLTMGNALDEQTVSQAVEERGERAQ